MGHCFETGRVASERQPVRFMYREAPDSDGDSGWRFFSGDEDQAYVDDPENTAIYAVTTIAEIDPSVIPYLRREPPCAFERPDSDSPFVESEFDFTPEDE